MAANLLIGLTGRWLAKRHRQGAGTAPPGSSTAGRAVAPRAGQRLFAALVVLAACSAAGSAGAQSGGEAQDALPPSDDKASSRCVIVEIAGYRSGQLDCASQRLQDAARIARDQARRTIEVPQTGSPDVTVGVSSLSGTRLRMGSALGHSVHPQRPGPSFAPPRLGGPQ